MRNMTCVAARSTGWFDRSSAKWDHTIRLPRQSLSHRVNARLTSSIKSTSEADLLLVSMALWNSSWGVHTRLWSDQTRFWHAKLQYRAFLLSLDQCFFVQICWWVLHLLASGARPQDFPTERLVACIAVTFRICRESVHLTGRRREQTNSKHVHKETI